MNGCTSILDARARAPEHRRKAAQQSWEAVMDAGLDPFAELESKLAALANAQFDSPEYRRLFALRWTRPRARIYMVQRSYFVLNRRDCWAYLQGSVPFDVKQIIWSHEQEELMGDDARGVENHYALGMREGAVLGLSVEDFTNTPPLPGTVACCYAWIHIAKDWPWLKALPVCAATEISNSDEIIKGGSFSRRCAMKLHEDLGIPLKEQPNNAEHIKADVEHAKLLMNVVRRHATTPEQRQQVLDGAIETWRIERAFKGIMADAMAACTEG
jgi:pyrroloquinoline quinone (PQQ) biosynthesis protein C